MARFICVKQIYFTASEIVAADHLLRCKLLYNSIVLFWYPSSSNYLQIYSLDHLRRENVHLRVKMRYNWFCGYRQLTILWMTERLKSPFKRKLEWYTAYNMRFNNKLSKNNNRLRCWERIIFSCLYNSIEAIFMYIMHYPQRESYGCFVHIYKVSKILLTNQKWCGII